MDGGAGKLIAVAGAMRTLAPRFLVVYGTTNGHTRKVASALASALQVEGAHVDLIQADRHAREVGPDHYDAVIVAASVHAGGYQRGVRQWVATHAAALTARPSAFISVCL